MDCGKTAVSITVLLRRFLSLTGLRNVCEMNPCLVPDFLFVLTESIIGSSKVCLWNSRPICQH